MVSRRQRGAAAVMLAAALSLLAGAAAAIETLDFGIRRIDADVWSAEGIAVKVSLGAAGRIGVAVSIDKVTLAGAARTLRGVQIECAAVSLLATTYRCARAEARIAESLLDNKPFTLTIDYNRQSGAIRVRSADLPVLGQRVTVDGAWHGDGWSAKLQGMNLEASSLYAGLSGAMTALPGAEVFAGQVSVTAEASAAGSASPTASVTLETRDLAMSNESGTLASESLAARVEITLQANGSAGDFDYSLSVVADDGEAYFEPAYFDFAAPLTVQANGRVDTENRKLELAHLSYRHTGALDASASAQVSWSGKPVVDNAVLSIEKMTFPGAYRTYVQGFLVGTPLAKLQTGGTLHGSVGITANRPGAVDVVIEKLDADDVEQRLAVYGVRGEVHWRGREHPAGPDSNIGWDGGFIYATGIGPGNMVLALSGDDVALRNAMRVPVLDGALVIDTFVAEALASERPALDFDAHLEPIGLPRLTTALGWPAFPGTLSGEIARLSLRDGVISLGGGLVAQVFDGTVRVSELRIEQPFAANRRGFATITLDNLDLGLITDVFSLGRIAGRLDGRIDGLQTVKNQPVAFDARFYTPPDDKSRHRISRRAINNLSEISGGGTALLTSGFLRFFEEFGYRSIGISCRLTRDLCEMNGLKPAERGYYIVEGRGIPRIDVIGHSRAVNWPRLVTQVRQALASSDVTTGQPSESQP